MSSAPILDNKDLGAPSVFEPAALLREARRQKGLPATDVPPVCVLDPDGDIVRYLKGCSAARPVETWPCYHTVLYDFALAGQGVGIVGCAVGAPFAVLVAEELFACGPAIFEKLGMQPPVGFYSSMGACYERAVRFVPRECLRASGNSPAAPERLLRNHSRST
jgi:hypothetical protein